MRVGAIGGGEVEVGAKGIGVGKDPTDQVGTGGVLTRRATAHVAPKAGSSAANWPASLALWVLSGALLLFLVVPLAALLVRAISGGGWDARAVEVLRQAVASGYRDGQRLQKEAALGLLRPRDDFQKLLAELKK